MGGVAGARGGPAATYGGFFLFRDGKLVDRLAGALPKAELIRWIDSGALVV